MRIQRYDISDPCCSARKTPVPDGEWVRWSDIRDYMIACVILIDVAKRVANNPLSHTESMKLLRNAVAHAESCK